jgi:hypothetical protein
MIVEHGDVDVFEKFADHDAENTVGKFDEVIAAAAGMPTTERVSKSEAGGKLPGFDQEASAISNPRARCFHVSSRLSALSSQRSVVRVQISFSDLLPDIDFSVWNRIFLCEGECECTSETARGQFSIFGAVEEMGVADFGDGRD